MILECHSETQFAAFFVFLYSQTSSLVTRNNRIRRSRSVRRIRTSFKKTLIARPLQGPLDVLRGFRRSINGTIIKINTAAMRYGAPGKQNVSSLTKTWNTQVRTNGAATAATEASDAITP